MSEPQSTIVVFEIAGTVYGVSAGLVSEILPAIQPVPLPDVPDLVDGIFNLRGQLIPIFQIAKKFGQPGRCISINDHFLVTDVSGHKAALRVDRVIDLIAVKDSAIQQAKLIVGESAQLSGVVRLADGLILLHDPETLLTKAEFDSIDRALGQSSGDKDLAARALQ